MKNKYLSACILLLMVRCVSSCFILDAIRYDYFIFRTDCEYDLVLFFDYNTADEEITTSSGSYYMWTLYRNESEVITQHNDSWDKHVKDSLHLYIIQNAIDISVWQDKHIHSDAEFIERYITQDYIKEHLIARMTLTLEDIFPCTDPPKEIVFPPIDDLLYNTIYYNCYK